MMWNEKALGLQLLGYYGRGGYQPGGFLSSLLGTWERADRMNRMRLSLGFPELAEMIARYQMMEPEEFQTWVDTLEEVK